VNNRSPVGLVSRQYDAVDWACVLCDYRIQWPSQQISECASMRLPIRQLSCRLFLAKHRITLVCQHPYSPDLAPWDFWFFSKLKSPLKVRRFVNATVTQYTSSVKGVSLPTDWPHGGVTVHGCAGKSPPTDCQVTSRPRDRFSRYSKWLDTFQTGLVYQS